MSISSATGMGCASQPRSASFVVFFHRNIVSSAPANLRTRPSTSRLRWRIPCDHSHGATMASLQRFRNTPDSGTGPTGGAQRARSCEREKYGYPRWIARHRLIAKSTLGDGLPSGTLFRHFIFALFS